jgi:hypothetical protein
LSWGCQIVPLFRDSQTSLPDDLAKSAATARML